MKGGGGAGNDANACALQIVSGSRLALFPDSIWKSQQFEPWAFTNQEISGGNEM